MEDDIWDWQYATDTWVIGNQSFGCGVYLENDKWYANVVSIDNIDCIGPFTTKEEAQKASLNKLEERKKEWRS